MSDILLELVKEKGLVKKIFDFKQEFECAELREKYNKKIAEIQKIRRVTSNHSIEKTCLIDEGSDFDMATGYNPYKYICVNIINTKIYRLREEVIELKIDEYTNYFNVNDSEYVKKIKKLQRLLKIDARNICKECFFDDYGEGAEYYMNEQYYKIYKEILNQKTLDLRREIVALKLEELLKAET